MNYARAWTVATASIVAAGFGVCVAVNWPGHLSYDSIVQLSEGRSARYGNWHPPVMSWLLGLGDGLFPGAGLFMLLDATLLYGAVGALILLRGRASWPAAIAALVLLATPQFLLYPGIVWKDVLFAAAAIAGFVSIAIAGANWHKPRARLPLVAVALLLLSLAALARQNGAVVLPLAALALGWIAFRAGSRLRVVAAAVYGAGWLSVAVLVCFCSWLALESRTTGATGPAGQFRLLQTYDLAGALAADPKLDLDRLAEDDPALEGQMRTNAARLYTPERNDTLATSVPLQDALRNADEQTIPAQWREFVQRHPLSYLSVRWAAFRWVFFTPDIVACRPAFAGVTGPPELMRKLGIAPRMDGRDRALANYALGLAHTPLFSHAGFACLAAVAMILLLGRRRPDDIAMAFMLASALAFAATFFVISIACDYRYLHFVDAATMVTLFYFSLDAREWAGKFAGTLRVLRRGSR